MLRAIPAIVLDHAAAHVGDVLLQHAPGHVDGSRAEGDATSERFHLQLMIGKSTREAMLIGAVHGYRGLIRALLHELKRELKASRLPVVATGGYARLMAARLPEVTAVEPLLTLEGLRLVWEADASKTRP